jgi:predicted GNAT family N-acyltransferase
MNSQGKPLLEFARIEHNSDRYRDLVALRRRVLRTPLGLDFTSEQLEKERDDVHIAAYLQDRLVACVSLRATDKSDGSLVRLRQMAVDPDHQGRGVGKRLIACAERLSAEMGYREIVLHARETAVSFYESAGYVAEGDVFTEVTIPHRKMVKQLAAQG